MRAMGWSWVDYCAAPVDLVQRLITLLEREHREAERLARR